MGRTAMSTVRNLLRLSQRPSPRNFSSSSSSAAISLTQEEVAEINHLIPRLCSSDHLKDATRLLSAAVLTPNPPIESLPLSLLINKLALEPDLTLPMYFLNSLKYNADAAPVIPPIVKMFVSAFFQNGQSRKALKVFDWVSRPDLNVNGGAASDSGFYSLLVDGFCKNGMVLESLRVVRAMVSENLVVGDEVRTCVYMGLLMQARVREALDFNTALNGAGNQCDGAGAKEVLDLLDGMITKWVA